MFLRTRRFTTVALAPKDGLDQASHKQPWKQSGCENLPRYLALSKFEVLYESPKRERVSQGIQGWILCSHIVRASPSSI
jgi:hypothetical protein